MFLIGINTKVKQTVAKTLGVPLDLVIIKPADVLTSPNNCVTGGSMTSELTCNVSIATVFWLSMYLGDTYSLFISLKFLLDFKYNHWYHR